MTLQNALVASALLSSFAAASAQWGPPGNGAGWGAGAGPFAAFPSCASSCKPANIDYSNPSALCSNPTALSSLNSCVGSSSCSDSDKTDIDTTIAQLCINAGASITQSPYNTYSVTSGESATITGGPWAGGAGWTSWASANGISGYPSASSAWVSWASANGLPTATTDWSAWASSRGWTGAAPFASGSAWGSLGSEIPSWTSAESITAWPTAASEWSSFTSAHPLPSDLSGYASGASANGFPGGSAWPTAWTTNSAWASAVSVWSASGSGAPPGAPGFHGGVDSPFGPAWGPGPWSSGSWESGPWTKWWGTNACPPSTWSGWTAGTWSGSAPWTSWTACSATATASKVYAITTTNAAGSQITESSTSFAYRLAEATSAPSSSSTSSAGAVQTNFAVIGSAAGALGVLAGAILL